MGAARGRTAAATALLAAAVTAPDSLRAAEAGSAVPPQRRRLPATGSVIRAGPTSAYRVNATWTVRISVLKGGAPCGEGEQRAARLQQVVGAHQTVTLSHCVSRVPAVPDWPELHPEPSTGVCAHRVNIADNKGAVWLQSWIRWHRRVLQVGELPMHHVTLYSSRPRLSLIIPVPHLWVTLPWADEMLRTRKWVTASRPYQNWAHWDCFFRYRASQTVTHVFVIDPDEVLHLMRQSLAAILARADAVAFRDVMYAPELCRGPHRTVYTARFGLTADGDIYRGKYIVSVRPPADLWGLRPLPGTAHQRENFCALNPHWPNQWGPGVWQTGKANPLAAFLPCHRVKLLTLKQGWVAHVRGALSPGIRCRTLPGDCVAYAGGRRPTERMKSGMLMQRAEVGDRCVHPDDPSAGWQWDGPEAAMRTGLLAAARG
eukprot:TRINITY_DN2683_c0_g1_i3.p1 TRINITY_DN2683_c0_g1~~TRINITY_DN2683_c0_g1_i3.p1  ORF type:complete len:430 (+),score=75.53 TRINITY_DN2683_c0_g1_i3:77-1366(+)